MTSRNQKSNFKSDLKRAIATKGYWSTEVRMLNDKCQDKAGHQRWNKWHDEARAEFHREKAI